MGLIRIEFDPPGYRPTEDFDFLWRKASEVLADLFPGAQVALKYQKAKQAADMQEGITVVEHRLSVGPEIVGESIEQVIGHSNWWRQLTLSMSEETRHFLGIGPGKTFPVLSVPPLSVGHGWTPSGSTTFRDNMPPELKYAFSICEDVTRTWAMHVWQNALPETRMAFSAQLPLWIVAHISADQCYSFGTYGSQQKNHDTLTQTVATIIEYLKRLAGTRVEHQELSHGIVIAPPSKSSKPLKVGTYPEDFQELKRTPLLADGVRAALWISPSRQPIGWITAELLHNARGHRNQFGPLGILAEASQSLRGLALGLRTDGSIVIFAKGRPLFIHRSGRWRGMLWNSVRVAIGEKYREVGTALFDAALILSTTGKGGILGIVKSLPDGLHNKDRVDKARKEISNFNPETLYSITTNVFV